MIWVLILPDEANAGSTAMPVSRVNAAAISANAYWTLAATATLTGAAWWPNVLPKDRFRVSPYNTYQHTGLPPTPIANPSVASVLAALNPRNTSCLFYFHDAARQFHCSDTYAEHVALLKKYFGRGK